VCRGEAEGWIKNFKRGLKAARLSCMHFWTDQFRILLHMATYLLMDELRRKFDTRGIRRMPLDTLWLLWRAADTPRL
jgi:hypothetical protein